MQFWYHLSIWSVIREGLICLKMNTPHFLSASWKLIQVGPGVLTPVSRSAGTWSSAAPPSGAPLQRMPFARRVGRAPCTVSACPAPIPGPPGPPLPPPPAPGLPASERQAELHPESSHHRFSQSMGYRAHMQRLACNRTALAECCAFEVTSLFTPRYPGTSSLGTRDFKDVQPPAQADCVHRCDHHEKD